VFHLVVPGLVESHPNHRVDEFAAANSTVDDRCQKYIQIGKNLAEKYLETIDFLRWFV
jgi:hypothetical protein